MSEKRLTLVGHLDELRKRIIYIITAVMIGSIVSYKQIDAIVDFILQPAKDLHFIYLSPADLFLAYIKLAIVSGFIITLPITIYQTWRFILPGIGKKQKVFVMLASLMSMIFFAAGALFSYYGIIPLSIQFFIKMSRQEIAPLFSFTSYMGFVGSLLLAFGITFQMPIFIMLLTQFNIITPEFLKRSRKVFVVLIFILAAILTPPDVISQILLAVPMLVLLELSIIVSLLITKRKNA